MADYIFGEIEGVKEGDAFKDRKELRDAGIHRVLMAGIDGNPRTGASSIVLNGGYVDDLDLGEEIIYTGHGGNDPNNKRQVKNQSWDAPGNKALVVSEMHGLPVRVTRGAKHKSKFSPSSGYEYGGVYYVSDHFEEIGKDGFKICRYKLVKEKPIKMALRKDQFELSEGNEDPKRVSSTTLRIVRDTSLSRQIKELYDYSCQICQIQISVQGVKYAEGAHIRPLGRPHNGKDVSSNLLCLCPNHHVMLDKGVISIDNDLNLLGMNGSIKFHKNHSLETEDLQYHRETIFKGE